MMRSAWESAQVNFVLLSCQTRFPIWAIYQGIHRLTSTLPRVQRSWVLKPHLREKNRRRGHHKTSDSGSVLKLCKAKAYYIGPNLKRCVCVCLYTHIQTYTYIQTYRFRSQHIQQSTIDELKLWLKRHMLQDPPFNFNDGSGNKVS